MHNNHLPLRRYPCHTAAPHSSLHLSALSPPSRPLLGSNSAALCFESLFLLPLPLHLVRVQQQHQQLQGAAPGWLLLSARRSRRLPLHTPAHTEHDICCSGAFFLIPPHSTSYRAQQHDSISPVLTTATPHELSRICTCWIPSPEARGLAASERGLLGYGAPLLPHLSA